MEDSADMGFRTTQTSVGSAPNEKTQIVVTAGKIFRDGEYKSVATKTFLAATTPSAFDVPTGGNAYFLMVADSASTPVLQMRGDKTVTDRVPDFTDGDTIIALIKMDASGTVDARYIQYLTTDKKANSLSIGYDNSDVYTEAGSITGTSAGLFVTGIGTATVAGADKVLIQDSGSSDVIKSVTAQSIADLAPQGDITGVDLTATTGIDITSEAGTTSGNYTATIGVDVSDFMANGANNYVVTALTADTMNAEANLTFNGSTLAVTGAATTTTSISAGTNITAANNLRTSRTLQTVPIGGDLAAIGMNVGGAIAGAATPINGALAYSFTAVEANAGADFFALPPAAVVAANGVTIKIKNFSRTVPAQIVPTGAELIDGGETTLSIITSANNLVIAPMGAVTLEAFVESYWVIPGFPNISTAGWVVTGYVI
jgi:hypothetical protein